MGRDLSKLKAELRTAQDQLKKSEKMQYECKKALEGKETAVEKLRKERDELWAVVNTDKYKNVKQIESDREKAEKLREKSEEQNGLLNAEIGEKSKKIEELELKIQELDLSTTRLKDKESQREKLLSILEDKSRKLEHDLKDSEILTTDLR